MNLFGNALRGRILRPETVKEMFRDQVEHLPMDGSIVGVRRDLARDVPNVPGLSKGWVSDSP
jgi:hypothetical protein